MDGQEHYGQKIQKILQRLDQWKLSLQAEIEDIKRELAAIMPGAQLEPETQPLPPQQTVSPVVSEGLYFQITTEEGYDSGTEAKYKEICARLRPSWGPRVWIDLISGTFSVLLNRRRCPVNLTGQKLELLCFLLRNFNKRINKAELEDKFTNHPQVLHQLHKVTSGVLKPFMLVDPGASRTLMPHSKDNKKVRFTFCLIEKYKKTR